MIYLLRKKPNNNNNKRRKTPNEKSNIHNQDKYTKWRKWRKKYYLSMEGNKKRSSNNIKHTFHMIWIYMIFILYCMYVHMYIWDLLNYEISSLQNYKSPFALIALLILNEKQNKITWNREKLYKSWHINFYSICQEIFFSTILISVLFCTVPFWFALLL